MEPEKKQVTESIYRFVQEWWPWLLNLGVLILIALAVASLLGCASSKQTERSTRDSVVYTYKTLYRDSLRVKDSTIIVYSYVQRDSVVLKVDKNTGEVLSKDSWHWKDTNKDKNHIADVRNMVEKSDSVASTAVKTDNRTVVPKDSVKSLGEKKTHSWKAYWLGMLTGVLVMLLWKYRKILVELLKKVVRLL